MNLQKAIEHPWFDDKELHERVSSVVLLLLLLMGLFVVVRSINRVVCVSDSKLRWDKQTNKQIKHKQTNKQSSKVIDCKNANNNSKISTKSINNWVKIKRYIPFYDMVSMKDTLTCCDWENDPTALFPSWSVGQVCTPSIWTFLKELDLQISWDPLFLSIREGSNAWVIMSFPNLVLIYRDKQ